MVLPGHRPGFDGNHFGTHREVFPYEDGAVYCVVPHRRVVSAIHNVYLDFHGSGQGRVAFVLGGGLQFVGFALDRRGNIIPMLRFIESFFTLRYHLLSRKYNVIKLYLQLTNLSRNMLNEFDQITMKIKSVC